MWLSSCQGGTVDIVLNLIISQFYSQAIAIINLCYKQIIIYLIFHTKILKEKKSSPGEARTRDLWHRKLTPTPLGHGVFMHLASLINIVITIDLSIFKIANRDWRRRCSNIAAYIHMVPFFDKIRSKSFLLLTTQNVNLTQFDVKWAISRKRGYSEDDRNYHTLGFFLYVLYTGM